MNDVQKNWKKIKEICLAINRKRNLQALSSDEEKELREYLAKAWKEYVNSLPKYVQYDKLFTIKVGQEKRVIRLKDIPEVLLKDDYVFNLIVKLYGRG